MDPVKITVIAIIIFSSLTMLFLAAIALRKRRSAGQPAVYLALCMVGVSIYDFGYAMELANAALPDVMFWVRFEHWGIQIISPLWLLFAACMAGREKLITRSRVVLLFILPLLFLIAAQTLGSLNLLHPNPRLVATEHFWTFVYDRGFLIYLSLLYQCMCLFTSTLFFASMLLRASPVIRKQAAIFLFGSVLPWFSGILYNMGLVPHNIDSTPFVLSLSAMIFTLGFLKIGILDIVPLARDVIFENIGDGMLVLDTGDHIIDFNRCLRAIWPHITRASVGLPASEILADNQVLRTMLADDSAPSAELQTDTDHGPCFYHVSLALLCNRRGRRLGKIITLHDITQIKVLQGQLEEMANRDGLTKLYNRRYFNMLADRELNRFKRYGQVFSVIFFDIDHFKSVNDEFGHAAGDRALQVVAETCVSLVRKSDILARFGGEEFIMLLPETGRENAARIADKLRVAIEQRQIEYEGRTFHLTVSFGVTAAACDSLEKLIQDADNALYQAKAAGRNRVCVHNDPSLP